MGERGDTIVEVIVAFAIFSLVAVGTISVMNRGISTAQLSLENTLVRQQIDSQAEMLRYVHEYEDDIWEDVQSTTGTPIDLTSLTACPTTMTTPSFILSGDTADNITYNRLDSSPSPYAVPALHSSFDVGVVTPQARGIWVVAQEVDDDLTTDATDFHIGACWNSPGNGRPIVLGTIVRLYDQI